MFSKVLIANRGEIALRCVRACRELGVRVAVAYAPVDRSSLAVRLADEAVPLEGPTPRQAYLNIAGIVAAAERCGAEAVHPGYGFLAENAAFARACQAAGLTFIGPTPEAIESLGDKNRARDLMAWAGLPVVPGTQFPMQDAGAAAEAAEHIGYPVLLKAAGGGGGRGMRLAADESQLRSRFPQARSEALAAFGSPAIYLEKYIARPRHVEIQILGDTHGNVVHLFERECSIQRRFQKMIEEAPSPALDPELRQAMGEAAVAGARQVGYTGAGTFEFLLDEERNFYFLEVNTRLQVEHPVTEEIAGIDIVKAQLRIAAGEPLGFRQEDLAIRGWSIECRITCEDPERQFAPVPSTVGEVRFPAGPGIRVDTHLYSGYSVPVDFDSLVAKLVATGRDRDEARRRMLAALEEFRIAGLRTTIPFHREVMRHPEFRAGHLSTHFVEEHPELVRFHDDEESRRLMALAAALESRALGFSAGRRETVEAELWKMAGRADALGTRLRL
ncbi:MAG: acetyl-CoA carboxylase biotin carboxylase subunit [Armatimonadetes bacterium]|nr:acetyl-CoA carboxylase biotin carboxylase subunit [Armatimonadota bacterium]